jgi:hypothetical protein
VVPVPVIPKIEIELPRLPRVDLNRGRGGRGEGGGRD